MNRSAIKDIMYGGIMEIMKNRNYFYHSSIGSNYCHFTDEGREALQEFMNLMGGKMMEAEFQELDQRARDQVVSQLRKKD